MTFKGLFYVILFCLIFSTFSTGIYSIYKERVNNENKQKNTNETHILDDIRDCNYCPCMDVLHGGAAMEVT